VLWAIEPSLRSVPKNARFGLILSASCRTMSISHSTLAHPLSDRVGMVGNRSNPPCYSYLGWKWRQTNAFQSRSVPSRQTSSHLILFFMHMICTLLYITTKESQPNFCKFLHFLPTKLITTNTDTSSPLDLATLFHSSWSYFNLSALKNWILISFDGIFFRLNNFFIWLNFSFMVELEWNFSGNFFWFWWKSNKL